MGKKVSKQSSANSKRLESRDFRIFMLQDTALKSLNLVFDYPFNLTFCRKSRALESKNGSK